jgi:hypothetical protein
MTCSDVVFFVLVQLDIIELFEFTDFIKFGKVISSDFRSFFFQDVNCIRFHLLFTSAASSFP